jgi:hypothetical protein
MQPPTPKRISLWSSITKPAENAVHQARTQGGTHGIVNIATRICTSNQCAFCMTIYADTPTCRNHMITAVQAGNCPYDRTHATHALIPAKHNKCQLCDIEHERYEDLQRHVRLHVPQIPAIVEPVIPPHPYSLAFSDRLLSEFRSRRRLHGNH